MRARARENTDPRGITLPGTKWSAERRRSFDEARAEAERLSGYPRGSRVRAHIRSPLYDGKIGIVVTYNLGEIGVSFDGRVDHVTAWFLPTELERISS